MSIFYVDPINGSNDNDGLSPDKAWKDISLTLTEEQSSKDDICKIYIRRGTVQELTEAIDWSANPNRTIVGWPVDGEYGYKDRPQAGIDAGWDNDKKKDEDGNDTDEVADRGLIKFKSTVNLSTNNEFALGFYNLQLSTDNSGVDGVFTMTNGNVTFDSCDIDFVLNSKTKVIFKLVRIDNTEINPVVFFNNNNIDYNGYMFKTMQDWSEVSFTFSILNNIISDHDSHNVFFYSYYDAIRKQTLNITNNKIEINGIFVRSEDKETTIEINLKNNKILLKNNKFFYSRLANNLMVNSENNVIDSKYSYFIEFNMYSNDSENKKVYINSIKDKINMYGHSYLLVTDKNTNKEIYLKTFNMIDVEMDNCDYIVNGPNCLSADGAIFFVKSNKLECNHIVNTNIENGIIILEDSRIDGYMVNKFRQSKISAKNCKINRIENNSGAIGSEFVLSNCEVGGSSGYEKIVFNGCKVSGNYPNATVEVSNKSELVGNIQIHTGTIKNCTAEKMPTATKNKPIEIFDCQIDDLPVPYTKITNKDTYKISNINRENGYDATVEINNVDGLSTIFNLDNIKVSKPANKQKIKMFFASQYKTLHNYEFYIDLIYTKDDKEMHATTQSDVFLLSDEKWNGLYEDYNAYETTIQVPDETITEDTDYTFVLTLIPKSISNKFTPIYVDMAMEFE